MPDELFEEALRSIERIEREMGTQDDEAGGPAFYELDDSADIDRDLDALMKMIEATGAGDTEPGADTSFEDETPDAETGLDLPEEPLAEPAQAAEDVADGDEIIARLLAQDRNPAESASTDAETNAGEAPRPPAEPDRRLQELLDVKEAQLRELIDRFQRLQTDFENFKKRTDRDKDEHRKFATEETLRQVLPIADSLERALAHARDSHDREALEEGVQLIYKQFQDVLTNLGLTPIRTVGEPFDPQFHEAMLHVETPDAVANAVTSEYQRGYLLHGRLLRPAKVAVAKGPANGSGTTGGAKVSGEED